MDTIIKVIIEVIVINLIINSIMFVGRKVKQLIIDRRDDKRFNQAQQKLQNSNKVIKTK